MNKRMTPGTGSAAASEIESAEDNGIEMPIAHTDINGGSTKLDAKLVHFEIGPVSGMMPSGGVCGGSGSMAVGAWVV